MNNTKNNIEDLTDDQKTLMTFCLLLSGDAFHVWTGEKQITPEIYREICQVASRFMSPALTLRICERFPGMATASHL